MYFLLYFCCICCIMFFAFKMSIIISFFTAYKVTFFTYKIIDVIWCIFCCIFHHIIQQEITSKLFSAKKFKNFMLREKSRKFHFVTFMLRTRIIIFSIEKSFLRIFKMDIFKLSKIRKIFHAFFEVFSHFLFLDLSC